jgi:hypothetical protein
VRQLLGWTSVRRSKPILKKDGTYFTRDPHDRRIAAPVDRRNIDRTLKAGYPSVTIAFEDGRAVQKSAVLKP